MDGRPCGRFGGGWAGPEGPGFWARMFPRAEARGFLRHPAGAGSLVRRGFPRHPDGAGSLAHRGCNPWVSSPSRRCEMVCAQGLKPHSFLRRGTARLKSCPDTKADRLAPGAVKAARQTAGRFDHRLADLMDRVQAASIMGSRIRWTEPRALRSWARGSYGQTLGRFDHWLADQMDGLERDIPYNDARIIPLLDGGQAVDFIHADHDERARLSVDVNFLTTARNAMSCHALHSCTPVRQVKAPIFVQ